jgi:hypothetical protein
MPFVLPLIYIIIHLGHLALLPKNYLLVLKVKIIYQTFILLAVPSVFWILSSVPLVLSTRICPHGGKQVEGEHFWATYAPVINWRTVLLVSILSLLSDLNSPQIDYVNTFTQAPADCDIFMAIPAGFTVIDKCLKITGSST